MRHNSCGIRQRVCDIRSTVCHIRSRVWHKNHGVCGKLHGVHGTRQRFCGKLHGVFGELHAVGDKLHGGWTRLHGVCGSRHSFYGKLHCVLGKLHGVRAKPHVGWIKLHGVCGIAHSFCSIGYLRCPLRGWDRAALCVQETDMRAKGRRRNSSLLGTDDDLRSKTMRSSTGVAQRRVTMMPLRAHLMNRYTLAAVLVGFIVGTVCWSADERAIPKQRFIMRPILVTNYSGATMTAVCVDGFTNRATTIPELTNLLGSLPQGSSLDYYAVYGGVNFLPGTNTLQP